MVWPFIVLGGAAAAAGALAGGLELSFRYAFRRGRQSEMLDSVETSMWRAYADTIRAGIGWVEAQEWEDWNIQTPDGLKLHARFLQAPGSRKTFLLAHGYRSRGHNDFSSVSRFLFEKGYSLLMIDQRAHSESEGTYITFGVKESGDIALWAREIVRRKGEDQSIVLDGVSMGAASVVMACGLDLPAQVKCAIADCGFTTPRAILEKTVRGMHLPARPILAAFERMCRKRAGFSLDGADTREAAAKTGVPIFFAHGTGDSIVPWEMSREGFEACRAPKELFLVPGAEHGCSWLEDEDGYWERMQAFLEKHVDGK